MRTKICTHCGEYTHPQPQDYNHDTGYGHCYDCLAKPNWYVASFDQIAPCIRLSIWEERLTNDGPLTSDDSHAKVVELECLGKVLVHATTYKTKEQIREWARKKIEAFVSEEA